MIRNKPNLVLIGFMGAGKSATGRELAARLGRSFIDLDTVISERAGQSIAEIFARQGEAAFRRMEAEAVREVSLARGVVIATGGGTVTNSESFRTLRRSSIIIWLAPPIETILKRLTVKRSHRPLACQEPAAIKQLYQERQQYYRLADYVICPKPGDDLATVAGYVLDILDPESPTLKVATPTTAYPYRLSQGFDFPVADFSRPGRAILVTDDIVGPLYADQATNLLTQAGWKIQQVTFAAGENAKTLANAERIWEAGFDFGLDRQGLVVALGGGVVGDLAGFAAATYMRGVNFLIIPTTLLAMVDSAIGGKVGVNHQRGKNLIGAFHHPRAVLAPLNCLTSLDDRNLAAGWAEVLKSALIGDAPFFDQVRSELPMLRDPKTLSEAVFRSARVKADIVARDEFEHGIRKYLNLGHTLGHGLEHSLGYGTLLHGEAVAIGMTAAAYAAEKLGLAEVLLTEVLANLLSHYGLPASWPAGLAVSEVTAPILLDKKNRDGLVTLIIPVSPGKISEIALTEHDITGILEGFRGEYGC